jgi:hypothetical protein
MSNSGKKKKKKGNKITIATPSPLPGLRGAGYLGEGGGKEYFFVSF